MEALGYKGNKTAFRLLAQRAPVAMLTEWPRQAGTPALRYG